MVTSTGRAWVAPTERTPPTLTGRIKTPASPPSGVDWTREDVTDRLTEWKRADGNATVRVRERADGGFVVRLDRLKQAPEGSTYRRETVPNRERALELAEQFRAELTPTE